MINFFEKEKISSLGGIEPPTFRLTAECATDYATETLYSTSLRNHVKYQYTIRFFRNNFIKYQISKFSSLLIMNHIRFKKENFED